MLFYNYIDYFDYRCGLNIEVLMLYYLIDYVFSPP